jgi:hypothetical protein
MSEIAIYIQSSAVSSPHGPKTPRAKRGGVSQGTAGLVTHERRSHHNHRHLRHGNPDDAVPEAMAGKVQHRGHESHYNPIRRLASGLLALMVANDEL